MFSLSMLRLTMRKVWDNIFNYICIRFLFTRKGWNSSPKNPRRLIIKKNKSENLLKKKRKSISRALVNLNGQNSPPLNSAFASK